MFYPPHKNPGSGHIDATHRVGLVTEQSTKTRQTGLCQYAHLAATLLLRPVTELTFTTLQRVHSINEMSLVEFGLQTKLEY